MKKLIIFSSIALILNSCAMHIGTMTGNASISDANYNIAGFAVGSAKTQHIFGIGGLGKDALVLEAKRNLYTNYPLKKGQALANVTVDFKNSFFPFVGTTKATITADIIDFNSAPNDSSFAAFNKSFAKTFGSPFTPNQEVILNIKNHLQLVRVIEANSNKSTVLIQNKHGNYRLKKVNNKKLFEKKDNSTSKYKIGEAIKFTYNDKLYTGTVQGINNDILIVHTYLSKTNTRLLNVKVKNVLNE